MVIGLLVGKRKRRLFILKKYNMNPDKRIEYFDEKVSRIKERLGDKSFLTSHSEAHIQDDLEELVECIILRENLKNKRDREV